MNMILLNFICALYISLILGVYNEEIQTYSNLLSFLGDIRRYDLTFVNFYKETCDECPHIENTLYKLSTSKFVENKLNLTMFTAKVNVSEDSGFETRYLINSFPSVILFYPKYDMRYSIPLSDLESEEKLAAFTLSYLYSQNNNLIVN